MLNKPGVIAEVGRNLRVSLMSSKARFRRKLQEEHILEARKMPLQASQRRMLMRGHSILLLTTAMCQLQFQKEWFVHTYWVHQVSLLLGTSKGELAKKHCGRYITSCFRGNKPRHHIRLRGRSGGALHVASGGVFPDLIDDVHQKSHTKCSPAYFVSLHKKHGAGT